MSSSTDAVVGIIPTILVLGIASKMIDRPPFSGPRRRRKVKKGKKKRRYYYG